MPSILIIDDDDTIAASLQHYFASLDWDSLRAANGADGLQLAAANAPDIILLDMRLPDTGGLDVLKRLRELRCQASVMVMTGWGSIGNAVEAVKLGAEQYLTKPVDLEELTALAERLLQMRKLRIENRYYQQRLDHPIIGASTEILRLHQMIDLMAENADTTVLLIGESGTGKELVAREIHRRSPRQERPFLDINCAVLSETLLESEIFGHERGAFTDARERKPGLLEIADGGTVFLDEIGEMPLAVQPKLLRVLETKSFKRVGGTKDCKVNVRLIAATNRDLDNAVKTGRFREDLYYRLKVFPVELPPLRERRSDIPLLIDHFIGHFNAVLKKSLSGFLPQATDLLVHYAWPGNVRELKNVVERAMVLAGTREMGIDLLPKELGGVAPVAASAKGDGSAPHREIRKLDDIEREYILSTLALQSGNRSTTARLLGIARSTLKEKLKKYGVADEV